MSEQKHITVAITGASGSVYGIRLIEVLLEKGVTVSVLVSKAALVVIATETDEPFPAQPSALKTYLLERFGCSSDQLNVYGREQWMAPVASGSGRTHAMVICPCSTGTLSAVSTGASNNLIERAADVCLKERRPLILVTRETPLSAIHLEHMLKLTQLGVTVMPACPGFYHQPASIQDLVDFMVARILSHLGVEHDLMSRWGEQNDKSE